MAKQNNKSENRAVSRVYFTLSSIAAILLLVIGLLAWWGQSFATNMVRDELSAQKIYFPPAGSPALDPEKYPGLQQYAGQLVDNGPKAKAYANEYIGAHLKDNASGKTYSEVSSELRADPDNQKLQAQRESLFIGETLRGILLGTGYAYWTIGQIAKYVSIVAFIGSVALAVLALYYKKKAR